MPQSLTRSERRAELYQAIGEATTAWARVEDQLSILFCYFVAGPTPGTVRLDGVSLPPRDIIDSMNRQLAARAAFHAVINFNSKLAMTDRAAAWAIFSTPHLDRWKTLHNRLGRQAKRRNDIAHFAMIVAGAFPVGPMEFYLSPSLQNVTSHMTGEARRLNAADVRQRAENFRRLAKHLTEFAVLIGAIQQRQEPLQGFAELLKQLDPDNMDTE